MEIPCECDLSSLLIVICPLILLPGKDIMGIGSWFNVWDRVLFHCCHRFRPILYSLNPVDVSGG